jgi:hypothetical protein
LGNGIIFLKNRRGLGFGVLVFALGTRFNPSNPKTGSPIELSVLSSSHYISVIMIPAIAEVSPANPNISITQHTLSSFESNSNIVYL